jgi:hypothetical protein
MTRRHETCDFTLVAFYNHDDNQGKDDRGEDEAGEDNDEDDYDTYCRSRRVCFSSSFLVLTN